jgi:phosphoglycerate kinase
MGIFVQNVGCRKIMVIKFPRLEDVDLAGKTVLVRTDLNVPMQGGKVTDNTRIVRLLPTLEYLIKKKCRIVLLSHFDRPEGKFVPSMSLAPLVDALSEAMNGKDIQFGVDCIGPAAREAVSKLKAGDIVLLENVRFHPEEQAGDALFARELASLGDIFINDAFSASHRAHASVTGISAFLPIAAGRLMEQELTAITSIFTQAKSPITAIVGGSKVSTKLELLESLIEKVDNLVIGGAMANTFLSAQGCNLGSSLIEPKLKATAKRILDTAKKHQCRIILPVDVMVGKSLQANQPTETMGIDNIPEDKMVLDIGNETLRLIADCLIESKTIIWNGPMGAFETRPFDISTLMIAREIARLTRDGKLKSIAGGGDTVAALSISGLTDSFSYISTSGGAFLEWLEGKTLPGVAALMDAKKTSKKNSASA